MFIYYHELTNILMHRVVFMGCAGYQDCGTANINWAMTFCPDNTMKLCVGTHAATTSTQAGASTGISWIRTYALAANTEYTFTGFAAGTSAPEGFVGG